MSRREITHRRENTSRPQSHPTGARRWRAVFTGLLIILPVFISTQAQSSNRSGARPDAIETEVTQLVRRIESRYGRMRGLAADFEQVYRGPGVSERRERGRLFLQRPRRMRWEYDPKPGKLFIVNNGEVWFYSPADREATHAESGSLADARFPFLFLLGQTNLRREFRSISFAGQPDGAGGARVLRLIPARQVNGLREIYLKALPDGQITSLTLVDQAGATSEVSLTNVSENYIAPATAFEFHPPPGVTVRRQ